MVGVVMERVGGCVCVGRGGGGGVDGVVIKEYGHLETGHYS